jgi:hypothetical protein
MWKINDLPEDNEDREEPEWLKEEHELYEAYERTFGEPAPMFMILQHDPIAQVRQALKTGQPIRDQTPPGCVS